jgi:CRP-like cAMP-binding protein
MNSRKFDPGDIIYRRGDEASSAFEVRAGKVRLSWPNESGLAPTEALGVGQIFGDAELIAGVARGATAEAVGDVVLNEIGRDDLKRLFANDAGLSKNFLRPLFEQLRHESDVAYRILDAEPEAGPPAPVVILSQLRLKPAARELYPQMTEDGVRIASLPFRVGRRSTTPIASGDDTGPIHLALADDRPYSLSRRHFAIETRNGGYVVRDCGSHHGTIVNGARIGREIAESVAPLAPGENRIVAGRASSPFRFLLTIETG